VERELSELLLKEAESMGIATVDPTSSPPLIELMDQLQRAKQLKLVLIIDEAVGVWHESDDEEERELLLDFFDSITKTPGRMAVWVGPEAPVRFLTETIRKKLEKVEWLKVFALNWQQTQELLSAKKFGNRYHIRVPVTLAKKVQHLTAGHPYWISWLGRAMYREAQQRQSQVLRFNWELLERAKEELLHTEVSFADRVYNPNNQERALLLLNQMATSKESSFNLEQIDALLSGQGLRISESELTTLVGDMEAVGALERSRNRWSLAAPILKEFFQYKQYHMTEDIEQ
jgi:hypothetical protein